MFGKQHGWYRGDSNLRPNRDEGFFICSCKPPRGPLLEYKFIQTTQGKLHTVVGGEGPPLILVHGFGDSNTWQTWVKNVDALSMVARVYAVELLGYGKSEMPAETLL